MTWQRGYSNNRVLPLVLEIKTHPVKMFEHSQYACHLDVLIAKEKNKGISFFTLKVTETGCIPT